MKRTILSAIATMYMAALFAQEPQIILSSRTFHPANSSDTLSTIKAVEAYKADRIDWMYCGDAKKLDQLKKMGVQFSLAINPQIPDSAGYTTIKTRIVDVHGKPVVAPWMRKWTIKNPYWGCVNNPAFRDLFLQNSKKIVDLGAYGIFVDDARFNDAAFSWGGCFCDYCVSGFNGYLNSMGMKVPADFNYKRVLLGGSNDSGLTLAKLHDLYHAYQTKSVVHFLLDWKSEIKQYANRPFVFLTNNSEGKWTSIYRVFDVGIAEMVLDRASYKQVDDGIAAAKSFGKKQIFSYAGDDDEKSIAFYLYCYLNGAEAIIPWDTYANTAAQSSPKRYYVHQQDMLPAIDFVKANRSQLKQAKSIKAPSFAKKSNSDDVLVCKKFPDGKVYLLATPALTSASANRHININLTQKLNIANSLFSKSPNDDDHFQSYKKKDLVFLKVN